MKKEYIDLMTRIITTLSGISTRGEDTLAMADCLRALSQLVQEASREAAVKTEEE